MKLVLSQKIRSKLAGKTPPVGEDEILQCFANRTGKFLFDTRANHLTNPPTHWFIAETDYGRILKVCFVQMPTGEIHIKTAYDPNPTEVGIYTKYGASS